MATTAEPGTCAVCSSETWSRAFWLRNGRTGYRTVCSNCLPKLAPAAKVTSERRALAAVPEKPPSMLFDPGRRLTRDEVETAYPGRAISADYGKPLDGDGQEATFERSQASPSHASGPQAAPVAPRCQGRGERGKGRKPGGNCGGSSEGASKQRLAVSTHYGASSMGAAPTTVS